MTSSTFDIATSVRSICTFSFAASRHKNFKNWWARQHDASATSCANSRCKQFCNLTFGRLKQFFLKICMRCKSKWHIHTATYFSRDYETWPAETGTRRGLTSFLSQMRRRRDPHADSRFTWGETRLQGRIRKASRSLTTTTRTRPADVAVAYTAACRRTRSRGAQTRETFGSTYNI